MKSISSPHKSRKVPARGTGAADASAAAAAAAPRQRHVELAQRVIEVALNNGWGAGDRMSEQALADQCNVSRTPMRKALELLCREGAVAIDPEGRGYRLARDPSEIRDGLRTLPPSEEEALIAAILRDLAAQRIAPAQTVAALQRRYGAGRLTVQNGLQRLLEDQIVERAAGQQWLFKPAAIGAEARNQSEEFRLLVEPLALQMPGFAADATALYALRQDLERLTRLVDGQIEAESERFDRMDAEFHRLIARGCPNDYLGDTLLNHQRTCAHFQAPANSALRLHQAAQEQLHVVVQIENRRFDLAADLLRVHLRMSRTQRPRLLGRGVPLCLREV